MRGFFRHVPQKIETFSIHVIRTLLRGASSTSHVVSEFEFFYFLDTLSCFAIVGWRVLKCSKIGHARRLGHFTREIALNDDYLSQILPVHKVFWMTLNRVFEIFVKLFLIPAEQHGFRSGGKILFWSHLSEEQPEKL